MSAVDAPTAESDSKAKGVTSGSTPHMSLFPGRKITAERSGKAVALNQPEGIVPGSQHIPETVRMRKTLGWMIN